MKLKTFFFKINITFRSRIKYQTNKREYVSDQNIIILNSGYCCCDVYFNFFFNMKFAYLLAQSEYGILY